MKSIKLGEKNIEIPSGWVDVPFKKFNEFTKILKSLSTDEEFEKKYSDLDKDIRDLQISLEHVKFNTRVVAFWTGLTEEEISVCELEEVDNALKEMSFLNETYEPIALSKFTINNETYYMPEVGMADDNFGTYIEAEQVEIHNQRLEKGDLSVIPKQAAIIAKKKGEKRGLINDKLVHKRAKIFENLDMATIWDIGFFLAKQEKRLMGNFLTYLKQGGMQRLQEQQKGQ